MASDRLWRDTNQSLVILDTSAVLLPFEYSIDVFGELTRLLGQYQIIIPDVVIKELQQFQHRGDGKTAQHAKAALSLIKKFPVIATSMDADEGIIEAATSLDAYVVTNDQGLRKRLQQKTKKVIYLRQKHYLVLDE